ncbi:MAG: pyrroloquinoline quinone biosynthesis protein PqqE [Beijerinckiaceae bacterium]|nr:pyrroloquinoline quinone biosynthesis protein PqqE [Beijerinckiaceae bacterium]
MTSSRVPVPNPLGILLELTHRCPLHCPYCSNPLELDKRSAEIDTATVLRVLDEAAELGILHVHLSGGEPTARRDIVEITAKCASTGLYSNLITSGVGPAAALLPALADAGLDHVQLSLQGTTPVSADKVSGLKGSHEAKMKFAAEVDRLGLSLTVNAVIHRGNIGEVEGFIEKAIELGARRLEIAHTQYYGWAYKNRAALMPARPEVERSIRIVEAARERLSGKLVIDMVVPDYYALRPKACAGGWGRKFMNVSPNGRVLPCHAAESIPGLEFWHVQDHSLGDIWQNSPAFNAYRGTAWMPEPCQSCERKELDWGGCRCQALALLGDASLTDPACGKSPFHSRIEALAASEAAETAPPDYIYRGPGQTVAAREHEDVLP